MTAFNRKHDPAMWWLFWYKLTSQPFRNGNRPKAFSLWGFLDRASRGRKNSGTIKGEMTCSKEPQAESNQDTAGRAKPSVHGPAHSSKWAVGVLTDVTVSSLGLHWVSWIPSQCDFLCLHSKATFTLFCFLVSCCRFKRDRIKKKLSVVTAYQTCSFMLFSRVCFHFLQGACVLNVLDIISTLSMKNALPT